MQEERILVDTGKEEYGRVGKVVTTYHEKKIGKTLYRITSVYKGDVDLGKALEELTIRKAIQAMRDEE
ncbi:hypothetical protein LJC27_08030 [Christensenellaceae bacterium OttesenSCG-928-M15]|nr:hypothetical protein [Christensenellaceae bacterium OttesenSCG-928-M15]